MRLLCVALQSGVHVSDMDFSKLGGRMDPSGRHVISTRIRVGRNIRGFGLSPGITREDRATVEKLVSVCLCSLWYLHVCVTVCVGACDCRCVGPCLA